MEPAAIQLDVRAALKEAMARFRAANVPSHTLAAELLLMHALHRDRAWLYAHPEETLPPDAAQNFSSFIARRAAGEPTQYITGKQEFWGLEFEVTPAVLIPRPETEHIIEVALERLYAERRERVGSRGIKLNLSSGEPRSSLRVADVGTGSGCLAVALARELPHAEIFATDISAPALDIGRRNASRHRVADRIHFVCGNLLEPLLTGPTVHTPPAVESRQSPTHESQVTNHESRLFDLIVSNPPYIGTAEAPSLPREVRDHEPARALFAGETGVEIYDRLVDQAAALLRPGGILVFELGYNSAGHVRALFERDLRWSHVSITMDLAGIERVLAAQRS
jgi:release factor glutamine methyltransferase